MRMQQAPRGGAWAGAALGLAMATAAEGVPMVAAGLVVAGLLWLLRPAEFAQGLRLVGRWPCRLVGRDVSDARAAVRVGQAGVRCDGRAVPWLRPHRWRRRHCAGRLHAGVANVDTAAASVLAAMLGGLRRMRRLRCLFPQCLGGGYAALGEDMETLWMSQISETRSLVAPAGR